MGASGFEDVSRDPRDGVGAEARVHAPTSLVERPRIRFFWLGGLGLFALMGVLMAAIGLTSEPREGWVTVLGLATAVGFGVWAVLMLRLGLSADESGIRVVNALRTHHIAWADLQDITFMEVQSEVSIGFHKLMFVTQRRSIVAAAPAGRIEPGRKLFELRESLLAMWARYTTAA